MLLPLPPNWQMCEVLAVLTRWGESFTMCIDSSPCTLKYLIILFINYMSVKLGENNNNCIELDVLKRQKRSLSGTKLFLSSSTNKSVRMS